MASRKRLKTSRRSYEECNYNESQERGYNFNQGNPEELQKSDYNYFLSVFECAENLFEDEEELGM